MFVQIINYIFVLCISSIVLVNSQHENHEGHDHQVKVAVYYEAMCPDSIAFVTKQLHPALEKPEISKHINLTLVPYGKSETHINATGTYFKCHHGPAECKGNKIHACALNMIVPDENGRISKVAVDFVNCLLQEVKLKGDQTEFPVKTCAESHKVPDYVSIENCAESHVGTNYLQEFGKQTELIQTVLKSSPTIVFDEKFKQDESSTATNSFLKALCDHIPNDKPADCPNKSTATLSASLGICLMLIITYLLH